MVGRILGLLERHVNGLHEAAYLLALFALLSQILALLRDRLFAHLFGAGTTLDVYYAAFRIPDLIFVGIASMVSLYVLIPLIAERMGKSEQEAKTFLSGIFSWFLVAIVAVSLSAWALMPFLVERFFPGFAGSPHQSDLVMLARILLAQPVLLGLSSLFASVIQLERRFMLYALSPVLYNLGIIVGAAFLYPYYGLAGLGYGVVLGALLHMSILLPTLFSRGFAPSFSLAFPLAEVKDVVLLSLPRALSLSAMNMTLLVFAGIASLFTAGSIAVFSLAFNLQSVPLAIVGMSYATAAFPLLASLYASGERAAFVQKVYAALRHIVFWSVPAVALFIVLRAQVVRVILGSGEFGWDDTRLTAAALALFVVSLVAQGILLLLSRAYYAAGNTRIPLYANGAAAILALVFAVGLASVFSSAPVLRFFLEDILRVDGIAGTDVLVLPLSYSLGAIAAALWLLLRFMRDFGGLPSGAGRVFLQSASAAILGGFASYLALNMLDDVFDITTFAGILMQGLGAGVVGVLAVSGVFALLKSAELSEAWVSLSSRFWKARTSLSGQDEF
jgi:putative peptidoglycan lipid II flippase